MAEAGPIIITLGESLSTVDSYQAREARRKVTNQASSYYIDGLTPERPLKFIKTVGAFFKKRIA